MSGYPSQHLKLRQRPFINGTAAGTSQGETSLWTTRRTAAHHPPKTASPVAGEEISNIDPEQGFGVCCAIPIAVRKPVE